MYGSSNLKEELGLYGDVVRSDPPFFSLFNVGGSATCADDGPLQPLHSILQFSCASVCKTLNFLDVVGDYGGSFDEQQRRLRVRKKVF